MSNILHEIETQIADLKTTTTKSNTGIVRECGDGVAKIEGLSDVMLNEMIEFPGGLYGLALNLEESEVGCILLGDFTGVTEGTEVKTTEGTGGKTAREVAEHNRIQQLGGVRSQPGSQTSNIRNPIGKNRQHLLKKEN